MNDQLTNAAARSSAPCRLPGALPWVLPTFLAVFFSVPTPASSQSTPLRHLGLRLYSAALEGKKDLVAPAISEYLIACSASPSVGEKRAFVDDVEPLADRAVEAAKQTKHLRDRLGTAFPKATFHLLLAKAYRDLASYQCAEPVYVDAAQGYEAAVRELNELADADERRYQRAVAYASLANLVIPVLAQAGANAIAQASAQSNPIGLGVGVVQYPVVNVQGVTQGARELRYMASVAKFSAFQSYLIVQCYRDHRGSEVECARIEEMSNSSFSLSSPTGPGAE